MECISILQPLASRPQLEVRATFCHSVYIPELMDFLQKKYTVALRLFTAHVYNVFIKSFC